MKNFAKLLEQLILTPSRNRKIEHLVAYFHRTNDPDRGYALAAITRDLSIHSIQSHHLKTLVLEHVDPYLFELSYDYVGDLAETISLIWPYQEPGELPHLYEFIQRIQTTPKKDLPVLMRDILSLATPQERWAMIKLVTGGLRIGVSARLAKTALALYGKVEVSEIEKLWHGLEIPYETLFAWLEGKVSKPDVPHSLMFHPMMLANPIDEKQDLYQLNPRDYQAEWKWDGIRVQIVLGQTSRKIFSRTGEDISHSFPDICDHLSGSAVLDGELLVFDPGQINALDPLPFNCLQQRLNRKTVIKQHLENYPAFVRVYDILFDQEEDLRDLSLKRRLERLHNFLQNHPAPRLDHSAPLHFKDWDELGRIRAKGAEQNGHEGLMLKRLDSPYIAGRPKGPWYKWKRDAKLIDTILMYAQRGHGKRSSFYSDFTFGIWKDHEIVPIGKAYFGFTDEELKALDKFVRGHTTQRFGPVREVEKQLVLEIAFDSAHDSPRHKSGIALRFPRIHRIRWDKPAKDAATLEQVRILVS